MQREVLGRRNTTWIRGSTTSPRRNFYLATEVEQLGLSHPFSWLSNSCHELFLPGNGVEVLPGNKRGGYYLAMERELQGMEMCPLLPGQQLLHLAGFGGSAPGYVSVYSLLTGEQPLHLPEVEFMNANSRKISRFL